MEILTQFIEVKVFLKESLKCTKLYIVGVVRGFLSTKKNYVENQCKKKHVLSVLYSIRQHDTPKSRASRAVFLKSSEKWGSG